MSLSANQRVAAILASLLLSPVVALAADDAAPATRDGAWRAFFDAGTSPGTRSYRVGLIGEPGWRWRFGPIAATGYVEASVGRWQVQSANRLEESGYTIGGITPVARAYVGAAENWFAEVGVGPNVISPVYHTQNKHFSTAFQFGDHIGIGWRSSDRHAWELALRYEHFSNASIKHPNPGINFAQLRASAAF